MSLAQGNNTPTRPRIEPGSPDPESDALIEMSSSIFARIRVCHWPDVMTVHRCNCLVMKYFASLPNRELPPFYCFIISLNSALSDFLFSVEFRQGSPAFDKNS